MIVLYGLYVVFSGIILALFNRELSIEWLFKMIIVSLLPIMGWLLPIMWPKKVITNKGGMLDDYMKQQDEDITFKSVTIHEKIEKHKELNVVAIEDALLISENTDRRRVMIDILKDDALHYLEVLQTAVQNEDTETSHYAVSAIVEVKRKLSLSMQELTVKYEQDKKDKYLARNYAKVLKQYMGSGFLDERTLRKYKYTYLTILEQIIEEDEDVEFAFDEKLQIELELGDFAAAEKTCLQYVRRYPLHEESYLSLIEYYFTTKSIVSLRQTLDSLKSSDMVLSNRALTIVRYWSEGADYESESKFS